MDAKKYLKFFGTTPAFVAVSSGQIIPVANDAEYTSYATEHIAGIRRLAIFPKSSDGSTSLAVIRFSPEGNDQEGSLLSTAARVHKFLQHGLPVLTFNEEDTEVTTHFDKWQVPTYLELTGVLGHEELNLWFFLNSPRPTAEVWLALQSLLMGLGISNFARVFPTPSVGQATPRLDEAVILPYYPGLPGLFNGRSYGSLQTGRTYFLDLNKMTGCLQQDPPVVLRDLPVNDKKVSTVAFDKLAGAVSMYNNQARIMMMLEDKINLPESDDTTHETKDFTIRPIPVVVKVELTKGTNSNPISGGIDIDEPEFSEPVNNESQSEFPTELQAKLDTWKQMSPTTRTEAVKSHLYSDFHRVARVILNSWADALGAAIGVKFEYICMWAREGFAALDLTNTDLVDILLRAQILSYTPEQCGRTIVAWLKSNGGRFRRSKNGPELEWKGSKFMVNANEAFKSLYWELTGRGDSRVTFDSALDAMLMEAKFLATDEPSEQLPKKKCQSRNQTN